MADNVFTQMAERLRHQGEVVATNNVNASIVDNEQIFWTRVYDLFEANYRENMCSDVKITSKRKIHIDNCESDLSSVHEPQMKWCPLLFFDGIVQIAMNKPFTSKQQSCNDRRQFNQHNILQNCIESIHGILSMNTGSSTTSAAVGGPKNAGISSTSSYVAQVTGHPTSNNVPIATTIAGGLPTTYLGRDRQSNIHTLPDSDDEEKPIIHDEKPIGNYSKTLYKNPNRRGDSWSYRSWLHCWGSFEMLMKCLDSFSGIGKSASKHQLTGLSLLKHLQSIPAVHVDARVSMEELMRPASFSEIFMYVRQVQTQKDKTEASLRAVKKEGASTRRSSKAQEKNPRRTSNNHNISDNNGGGGYSSYSNGGGGYSSYSNGGGGYSSHSNGGGAYSPRSNGVGGYPSHSNGGGAQPIKYENLDETASEGSDHDDEKQIAVKRSRLEHSSEGGGHMGNSLFKSSEDGNEGGGGTCFVGKRKNGASRRQKPLPSGSESLSRGRTTGISPTVSSLPAALMSSSSASMTMNSNHNSNNNHLNHIYHHNNYHHHHFNNNNPCALANVPHAATLSQPTYNYNNPNAYLHHSSTHGAHLPPPLAIMGGAMLVNSYENGHVDLDAVLDFI